MQRASVGSGEAIMGQSATRGSLLLSIKSLYQSCISVSRNAILGDLSKTPSCACNPKERQSNRLCDQSIGNSRSLHGLFLHGRIVFVFLREKAINNARVKRQTKRKQSPPKHFSPLNRALTAFSYFFNKLHCTVPYSRRGSRGVLCVFVRVDASFPTPRGETRKQKYELFPRVLAPNAKTFLPKYKKKSRITLAARNSARNRTVHRES